LVSLYYFSNLFGIGIVVITDENFYGQIPQIDKTLQNVTVSRSAINSIVFPDKGAKTFKLETPDGFVDIGKILDSNKYTVLKQLLDKKGNEIKITVLNSSEDATNKNEKISESNSEVNTGRKSMDLKKILTAKTMGELIYGDKFVQEQEAKKAAEAEKKLRCPKCSSENIEPIPVTTGKTKGFGLGKAAIGGLALGPVGLAAGVLGMGKGKQKPI
jgi:hypothetical protein